MSKQYAIYLNNGRDENCVLLTDGAWTPETNCFRKEYGVIFHRPQLFPRKRTAADYIKRSGLRADAREYTGPQS